MRGGTATEAPRPQRVVERDAELAALRDVLDAAAAGSGRTLLVEGAGGLGRTTLLAEAVREARERRMEVLRATGAHTEREHPFGVMRRLLEPRLARASAAEGDSAVAVLERASYDRVVALAGVAAEEADLAVDAIVASEVLVAGDELRFAHPLLREAVYGEIPPRERARRHAAAAAVPAAAAARPEEIAAHVRATDGPLDERAADVLERAAAEALAVEAPETALECLRVGPGQPPMQRAADARMLTP